MSLASTVSSVIDVPATHSSGVERIWPAWTDAISSSVEAKTVPPTCADERLVRLGDGAGRSTRRPTTASTTDARRRAVEASRAPESARPMPSTR